MKGGSPRLTGNLGIAVDETLLQYRLVNVINNFRQMAPDVTIKVELGTAYSIKDMVLRSEVDLAVSFNMGSYESPLTALPLCSEELGLFGSPRLKIEKEQFFLPNLISLKYANGLRNGANSDTHRCKQLTEHGEERCIKLREVAGFSAVRTIFQIVGPRKILHCLLGK